MRILSRAVALLLVPLAGRAQAPATGPRQQVQSSVEVDTGVARRIVERAAALAEQSYLFPDTGRMIGEHVRERLRAGAYSAPLSAGQLADRLGADLKSINGDLHLYVNFVGGGASDAPGPRIVMRRPGEPPAAADITPLRRANYFVRSAERLAGNVGYVSIAQLNGRSEEALRVFDAAMAFLQYTDAMILDLRRTPGGDSRMSDYIASYFLADSVHTLDSYTRATNETRERWTAPVAGKKRTDIPLFVLVGPGTASGAEDLAFALKQTGRATLVGEKTAGAGRLTRIYPLGDGFVASIPGGRTYDPRTGMEWERTGVLPDVSVQGDAALPAAQSRALSELVRVATDTAWKTSLQWARELVDARARPVPVSASALRGYAGTYDTRAVIYDKGKLWYQRDPSRPRVELVAVDQRTFVLDEEAAHVEFLTDNGRVTGFRLTAPGTVTEFPRTSAQARSRNPSG
jgi:hypothetical protein